MASNYPPGVTGHEPQIAGGPEGVEHLRCVNVIAQGVDLWQGRSWGHTSDHDVECTYVGPVDVVYGSGVADNEWTGECPACEQPVHGYADDDHPPVSRLRRRVSS